MSLICAETHLSQSSSGQQWQMVFGEKREKLTELAACILDHSQHAAAPSREHVTEVAEFLDNSKLVVIHNHLPSMHLALPRHWVHLNSGSVEGGP